MSEMSSSKQRTARKTILVVLVVLALIALAVLTEVRRRQAEDQLKNLSVRLEQLQGGNTQQNRETARRIVQEVRERMQLPEGEEPTVATIVNVELLRNRNPFYAKAKNGDHLIVTRERAILYDPEKKIIIDVVPVQIETEEQAVEQGGTAQ